MTADEIKEGQNRKKKPIHHELEHYKKALVLALDFQAISKALQQIDNKLTSQPIVFDGSLELHSLITDIFKPITREITNSYIRQESKVKIMQSIIRKIILQYISIFRLYGTSSVLQILKELLDRDTFLFVKHHKYDNDRFKPGTKMQLQIDDNFIFDQAGYEVQQEKVQIRELDFPSLNEYGQQNDNNQQFYQPKPIAQKMQQKIQTVSNEPEVNPQLPQQQKTNQEKQPQKKFKLVLQTHKRYTDFYLSLIQEVLLGLQGTQQQFNTLPIDSIVQYYHLLYSINQVIIPQKLLEIVSKGIFILAEIFQNPSKQLIKEANKDSLEKLSDSMNQCIRYSSDYQLKVQISLLGPTLAIQLFKQTTIYEKMQGLKILNKYASSISFRHVNYLPQSQFGKWLCRQHIFQMIYNLQSSLSLLQAAQDIFKCYARCRILNRQLIQRYINLIDSCQSQTRQYLIKLLQSISIKIQYEEVLIILEKFENLRKIQYYSQDFFTMITAICKYNSENVNRKALRILGQIVNQYYDHFSANVQSRCMNCYIAIFNNVIDKVSFTKNKLDDTVKILQTFLDNPTSFNLTIMKRVFQFFPEIGRVSKNTLATHVIERLRVLDKLLEIIQKHKHLDCQQLQKFIKFLLNHYRFKGTELQLKDLENLFSYENMIRYAYYPQIFCLIVEFIFKEKNKMFEKVFAGWKYMENLMRKLIEHLGKTQQCFNFQCIKTLFCLINDKKVIRIDKGIVQREFQYSIDPQKLTGFSQLTQLLYTTKFSKIKQGCASFIVQMYTLPSEQFIQDNQKVLLQFMGKSITQFNQIYQQYSTDKTQENKSKLIGTLYLLLQLLCATEPFGVGQLASHNSLVATSTIVVRISNEFSDGKDVLKIFQKKFPSNTTIFQVIKQACIQFKCCPADILLKSSDKNFIPLKYNSWILEQVPFDCKKLIINRTFRNLMRKKSLVNQKGQLSSQAKQLFTKIFKIFAGQGLMGKYQLAEFIEKATQVPCTSFDHRVIRFFQQYDKKRNNFISLEDFLKFYYECCIEKPDVVWKNLACLRFRRDLKYYDEPIQLGNKQLMLRTQLCSSNKIYEILFNLLQENQQQDQLKTLTKQFLNRLPTYPKVINSIEESFNLLSKNAFLSQYILIALQEQLNKKTENIQEKNPLEEFISKKYYLKIYEYLISLEQDRKELQKCKAICLHILRSLLPIPSLRNQVGFGKQKALIQCIDFSKQGSILYIPETKLFENLIKQSLKTCDIETYEISLVLLLTQKIFDSSWLKKGIFNSEQQIRRITCNFILLSTKINPQAFDLFEIAQQQPCSQWFELLVQIILYTKKQEDFNKIFTKKCQRALCGQQTLEKNYDPILNGNLNIIKTIILKSQHKTISQTSTKELQENQQEKIVRKMSSTDPISLNIPQDLCDKFIDLLSRTLSNQNRKILYELISLLSVDKSIDVLLTLIDKQYPTRQAQVKQYFVGIKNLGCICYMNSILQQFFFMADFRNFVMQLQNKQKLQVVEVKGKKIVDDFLYQLQKMYVELFYSQKKYVDPTDFCLAIKDQKGQPISITIQQDAHEFLNQLFGMLQKYIKAAAKKQQKSIQNQTIQQKQQIDQFKEQMIEKTNSMEVNQTQDENLQQRQQQLDKKQIQQKQDVFQNAIEKSFAGKTVTLITCKTCQNRNVRKEDITHLTVQVKGMSTLEDSINKLIESEEISDYQCDHCQKKVPSGSIQKLLYKLPDTLIINLLRITFDVNTFQKIKVHSRHEFPDKLNLKDYLFVDQNQPVAQQQTVYYLHGVVIHSGTSESGHYYSLIKIDNQWYKFNDMSVTKFDPKNIAKQSFGGNQASDDWGQATFSTNAYILFYSRQKQQPRIRLGSLDQAEQLKKSLQIKEQSNCTNSLTSYKNSYSFLPQIIAENNRFYFQLQINQKSFFEFAIELYERLKPDFIKERIQTQAFLEDWYSHPKLTNYQSLLDLFLKIVNFVSVFYQFPTNLMYGIGQTTYQLFFLVPERTYKFFIDIDPEIYFIHLTTHNQGVIRQLYKCVLNKALHVYDKYFGFNWKGFKQQQMEQKKNTLMIETSKKIQQQQELKKYVNSIPQQCKEQCNLKIILLLKKYIDKILHDDTIKKNLFKCNSFFEFWKYVICFGKGFLDFALDNNLLEVVLDFIMGKDSPFKGINEKRQDCPYPQSIHVLHIISTLQQCKLGLQDDPFPTKFEMENLRTLTFKQKKILSDPFFYRKMLRDKHDQQILPTTLASLCYQNRRFSQDVAELLITGFSYFDNIESWNPLFAHIKTQLYINDSFASDRITWLLGIPQFSSVYKLEYSLRDNTGSKSIQYFSNLFFMVSETYQPLLQRLYEKRFRFDLLTINGIITLLQLLYYSEKVLDYVINLPPPTYNMLTYVDWIQSYVQRLQNQDSLYGIGKSDKESYVGQIKKLLEEFNKKVNGNKNLPSLKYIIGKNKTLILDQFVDHKDYQIKLYRHKTYIIDNLPTGKSNLSLPADMYHHGHPIGIAKYFVNESFSQQLANTEDIKSENTVITLQIKTKKKLRIKINSKSFNYELTTVKGDIDINLPYDPKPLEQLVEIDVLQGSSSQKQIKQQQKSDFKINLQVIPPANDKQDNTLKQIECPRCTFLNLGVRKCQMCEQYLSYDFL